jgi:uncharacterized protein (DUF2235 family)
MAKNLVVCFDGTGNTLTGNPSNVAKLFMMLRQESVQVAYYHPGIGTLPFASRWTNFLGAGLGRGIHLSVADAYTYLVKNYEPGDKVFLFGFSRGAYTVRVVASMLRVFGVLRPGHEHLALYLIDVLRDMNTPGAVGRISSISSIVSLISEPCDPWFVGVWDTVASLEWPWEIQAVPFLAHNPSIRIARQAISIDERRAKFRPVLWFLPRPSDAGSSSDLKQVWFPGVHSDVGGGYPEEQSGLSKVALQWLVNEAEAAGLCIDRARRDDILGLTSSSWVKPDPSAPAHEELGFRWAPLEFVPVPQYNWKKGRASYRLPLGRRRVIPPRSLVHESAFARGDGYCSRLPADVVVVH